MVLGVRVTGNNADVRDFLKGLRDFGFEIGFGDYFGQTNKNRTISES